MTNSKTPQGRKELEKVYGRVYTRRSKEIIKTFLDTMKRRGYSRKDVFDLLDEVDVESNNVRMEIAAKMSKL